MKDQQVKKHFVVKNRRWLIDNIFRIIDIDGFYTYSELFKRIY